MPDSRAMVVGPAAFLDPGAAGLTSDGTSPRPVGAARDATFPHRIPTFHAVHRVYARKSLSGLCRALRAVQLYVAVGGRGSRSCAEAGLTCAMGEVGCLTAVGE